MQHRARAAAARLDRLVGRDLREAPRAQAGDEGRERVRGVVLVGRRPERSCTAIIARARRDAARHGRHLRGRLPRVRPAQAGVGLEHRAAHRGRAPRDARVAAARDGPAREQPRVPRDGEQHEPVRRPVRHRVGHHERVLFARRRAERDDRDGRAGHLRGADRDRDGPVRRDPGRHRLQPVRRPGRAASRCATTRSWRSCRRSSSATPRAGSRIRGRSRGRRAYRRAATLARYRASSSSR